MTHRGISGLDQSWAPLWWAANTEVQHRLSEAEISQAWRPDAIHEAASAIADGFAELDAVAHGTVGLRVRGAGVDVLIDATVRLLAATTAVTFGIEGGGRNQVQRIGMLVGRRLDHHEEAVVSLRSSYDLKLEDARRAASVALTTLAETPSVWDALPMRHFETAAVDLASMMIRAAGNLERVGQAVSAPQECPLAVRLSLDGVIGEIAERAEEIAADRGGDEIGRHLEAAADLAGATTVAGHLEQGLPEDHAPEVLAILRDTWLQIAGHHYCAVELLIVEARAPSFAHRFTTLKGAVAGEALEILRNARLCDRPEAVAHGRALHHHGLRIAPARAAYAQGARRSEPHMTEITERIALDCLTRATVALVCLAERPAPPRPALATQRQGSVARQRLLPPEGGPVTVGRAGAAGR
ncbi:hypothetical protein AB0L40_19570 [Patulibacter sp. NPDC049589]|uniref:hypothetical protein n=1 Tax=Patulibacter sp. NPDC049589 TaxID=3154731 RepID=UPI003430F5C8